MKRQNGFTLIELVVVIVILGILAATAAPKFMDLQKDARIATINGLKGAISSAVAMTYAKAILAGQDKASEGSVCNTGSATDTCNASNTVATAFGRPAASLEGLLRALDLEATETDLGTSVTGDKDWGYKVPAPSKESAPKLVLGIKGSTMPNDDGSAGCGLIYTESADANTNPTIKIVDKC